MTGGVNSMAPSEALACSQDAATSTLRKRPASQSTQLREFFQRLPPNSLCLRSRCEARLGVALWDPILIISRVEPVRRAELG